MITVYDYFGKIKEDVLVPYRLINNRLLGLKVRKLLQTVYPQLTKYDTLLWYMFEQIPLQEIAKQLPEIQDFVFDELTKHCLSSTKSNTLKLQKSSTINFAWIYNHPFVQQQEDLVNFNYIESITSKQVIFLKNNESLAVYKKYLPIVYFSTLRFHYKLIVNEVFYFRIPEIVSITQKDNVTEFIHDNLRYIAKPKS